MINLECDYCGSPFSRKSGEHRQNIKRNRTGTFCSKACFNSSRVLRVSLDCLECNTKFEVRGSQKNKAKFCSQSCSARFNNRLRRTSGPIVEGRAPEKFCRVCNTEPVYAARKTCPTCLGLKYFKAQRVEDYTLTTLQDWRDRYSTSQFHAKIRNHSRFVYKQSKQPMICRACGYAIHVDICHVIDVKDFPPSATIAEVNDISNLVALDKRCHWEFDHGHLVLDSIQASSVG